MHRIISVAALVAVTAVALAGCSAAVSAPGNTGPDPKESCRSFEAAANNFIDSLAEPARGTAEKAVTSMNEAAAYASGDVQKVMGDALLSLPQVPADLATPEGRAEAKTVNDGLHSVAEACKAAGADIALHTIPAA
jgi:hypothetical protein